jgi:hypothetical protein
MENVKKFSTDTIEFTTSVHNAKLTSSNGKGKLINYSKL